MISTMKRLAVAAAVSVTLGGCASDPEFWDALNESLNMASDQIAWENANCYWGPIPGGDRYGAQQRYCPGDYGYQPPVALPPSYYRDRRRDRDHDHGRDHRRDRGHDRRDRDRD